MCNNITLIFDTNQIYRKTVQTRPLLTHQISGELTTTRLKFRISIAYKYKKNNYSAAAKKKLVTI